VKAAETVSVALYARVSSDHQAKQQTIHSQVEALHQRVARDGLSVPPELCFLDDGHSGSTLLRPALERLRDQAAAGAIDRLYVHSPDRLARNYAYQVLLLDELHRAGVAVVFLNGVSGNSPEENLLVQVQGMIAEYERAKILERSRRGKLHAARQGRVNVLAGAPYGYRYVSRTAGGGEACYQVVEAEAEVVRQIFRWVGQERCSLGAVCRRLQQQNTPSPKGNATWDRSSVWSLLKNPAYKGLAAFGKTRVGQRLARLRPQRGQADQAGSYSIYPTAAAEQVGIPVPALVEVALFDAVAEQLAENKQRQRQLTRGASYLLQGLVVCTHCARALYGKPVSRTTATGRTRYAYYRCLGTEAYRFGGTAVCGNRAVRTEVLDAAVWADVQALLADPGRIQKEYERRVGGQEGSGQERDEQLPGRLQKARQVVARLIDAYAGGLLAREEFEPRLQQARQRLEAVAAEAEEAAQQERQEEEVQAVLVHLEEFAQRINEGLEEATWATRREIIRALVKRIEVGTEEVRVVYKVNPRPFVEGPERGRLQDRLGRQGPVMRTPR
jgi:site-specific DNA recombinase